MKAYLLLECHELALFCTQGSNFKDECINRKPSGGGEQFVYKGNKNQLIYLYEEMERNLIIFRLVNRKIFVSGFIFISYLYLIFAGLRGRRRQLKIPRESTCFLHSFFGRAEGADMQS